MNDSFIHITDLHFWEIVLNPLRLLGKRAIGNVNVILKRRHDFIMERAENYAQYVNELDVEQVIITGDFASTATRSEFQRGVEFIRLLEASGKKVSVIPGNHDVYTFTTVRRKVFDSYYSEWLPSVPLPCTQTLPNGTPYVYVPTVCANKLSSKGRISRAEIASTVRQMEALPGPGLVIGHYPILNKTASYTVNKNRQLRNAEDLREALGETEKEMLYVCGHVHRFSDEIDPKYSNIRHLTTGAFFRTAPESQSDGDFSIVEVGDSDFRISRHVHRNGAWCIE